MNLQKYFVRVIHIFYLTIINDFKATKYLCQLGNSALWWTQRTFCQFFSFLVLKKLIINKVQEDIYKLFRKDNFYPKKYKYKHFIRKQWYFPQHNIIQGFVFVQIIQRYAIIVEYFYWQLVFTEKLVLFSWRVYRILQCGGKRQNYMKNISARQDEYGFFLIVGSGGEIDSGVFCCASHQYFFAPPPLKYSLHTPAEKSSCFSKYDQPIKSIKQWLGNAVQCTMHTYSTW